MQLIFHAETDEYDEYFYSDILQGLIVRKLERDNKFSRAKRKG